MINFYYLFARHDDTIVLLLEPSHSIALDETMLDADSGLSLSSVTDVVTGTGQHNVEVHTVDTNTRIVLQQEDMHTFKNLPNETNRGF